MIEEILAPSKEMVRTLTGPSGLKSGPIVLFLISCHMNMNV